MVITMRHILLSTLFLQLCLMLSPASRAEDYQLGQGWHTGNYFLSGYANIEVVDPLGAPTRVDLDDLSLFAGGRINQWVNPFMEAELSKHTLVQEGGAPPHGDYIVERFYSDAMVSEHDTLRFGKMLTPLGGWNVIHAAPLMPTITRPLTTSRGFHAYVSGASWIHDPEDGENPELQLYWQPDNEWFKRSTNITIRNFHNVVGGQINKPFGLMDKIGASFQHGQLVETGEMFTLYGVNANKSFGKLRLEGEAITSNWSGTTPRAHDQESGIFGLADYSFTPKWHGILEGEYYQDHTMAASSRNTLVAVAYKPSVPMIWKLEYVHQAGESASFATIRTGWKAAFSVMF